MKKFSLYLLTLILVPLAPAFPGRVYDIRSSGATGDGGTDNTIFIQKAIDSCAVTGGTVYIPEGVFLTATLVLKSNVTLHVSAKGVLLGHTSPAAYPYQDSGIPFYGGEWAKQALIFCKGQENVSIEGSGAIDGQGAAFVTNTLKKPDRYRNRPYLLWFAGCKNVRVSGVRLRNSAFWMQHYLGCERVVIDGIDVWNHSNKNNDMIDIDGCRYVMISNVTGDADDDGITIKSTSKLVSEHITITNCVLSSHCNAIKFGTESTGGFRNITISNCVIKPSAQTTTIYGRPAGISGVSLEMVDGGILENVTISNLVIDGPEVPLFIRLGNRARKHVDSVPAPGYGQLRNVSISDIVANAGSDIGCSVTGLKASRVQNISLRNIQLTTPGGGTGVALQPVADEKEDAYPEATMFGKLPAHGFYISHATGIRLSGIQLHHRSEEKRPAFFFHNTEDFSLECDDVISRDKHTPLVMVSESREGGVTVRSTKENVLETDKASQGVTLYK